MSPSPTQRRGGLAEDQAVLFLQRKGWTIIDRHVTSRYGEIDILAQDGETIVAVEVKMRQTATFGRAIEAVTSDKLEKVYLALSDILDRQHLTEHPFRIDVITIEPSGVNHLIGVGPAT